LAQVGSKLVLELGNMQLLELVRSILERALVCSTLELEPGNMLVLERSMLVQERSKLVLERSMLVLERSMLVLVHSNRSSPYGIRTSLLRW
jgi:hypothetical protein